jgi:hypothetical protein
MSYLRNNTTPLANGVLLLRSHAHSLMVKLQLNNKLYLLMRLNYFAKVIIS